MKRLWSGVLAAVFAATVAVAAQDPPPSPAGPAAGAPAAPQGVPAPAGERQRDTTPAPGSQREIPAPAQANPNTVTISGCVQNAPPAANAAAGAAAEQQFVLANAKMAGGPTAGAPVGTSGTAATRYELDGTAAELSKHLNHQVEITGMVQSSSASPTGAANSAPGSRAAAPKLKVSSVKMVSDKCTSPTTAP